MLINKIYIWKFMENNKVDELWNVILIFFFFFEFAYISFVWHIYFIGLRLCNNWINLKNFKWQPLRKFILFFDKSSCGVKVQKYKNMVLSHNFNISILPYSVKKKSCVKLFSIYRKF